MLPGGILLACLGLIGWGVERWRWGRGPRVTRIEIFCLLMVSVGALVTLVGLVLFMIGEVR